MATGNGMNGSVRPKPVRQHGDTRTQQGRNDSQVAMRLDDIAAKDAELRERQRRANEQLAIEKLAPVMKGALALWPGGQEAYAARLGVARSIVVEMCDGKRLIGPRDWLPLREHQDCWIVWTEGVGALGNLLVMVMRRPTLSFADMRDDALGFLRRNPDLWRTFRQQEAVRRGVTEEEIDQVAERGEEEESEEQQHAPVQP